MVMLFGDWWLEWMNLPKATDFAIVENVITSIVHNVKEIVQAKKYPALYNF